MKSFIKITVHFVGTEYEVNKENIEISEDDIKEKVYKISLEEDTDTYYAICNEKDITQMIKKIINKRVIHLMNKKTQIEKQIKELLLVKGNYIKISENIYREV